MRNLSLLAAAGFLSASMLAAATPARAQYYDGGGHQQVRCESHVNGNRRVFCPVPGRGGVRIVQQLSRTPCLQGRTWFAAPHGVYVRGGCRAVFASGYGHHGRPPYPHHRPRPEPREY